MKGVANRVKLGMARIVAAVALAVVSGTTIAFPFFGSTDGGGGFGQPTFGLELNNAFDPLDRMLFRFDDLSFTALDSNGLPASDPSVTAQFEFSGIAVGGEVDLSTGEFIDAAMWQLEGLIDGLVFDDQFIGPGSVPVPAFVALGGSSSLIASVTYTGPYSAPGDSDPADLAFTSTDENTCSIPGSPGALECRFELEFDPTAADPVFVYFPDFLILPNQTLSLLDTGSGQAALVHNACDPLDPTNGNVCSAEYNNSSTPSEIGAAIGPKFQGRLSVQTVPEPATLMLVLLCALPLSILTRRRANRRG